MKDYIPFLLKFHYVLKLFSKWIQHSISYDISELFMTDEANLKLSQLITICHSFIQNRSGLGYEVKQRLLRVFREAFKKNNDKTYGKFHILGGGGVSRGSFSICYHERF